MRKIVTVLFGLLIPLTLNCQSNTLTSQYVLNPVSINPAYAGVRKALNLSAFYRKQWVGIKGSPETLTLTADGSLMDNKLGLGLLMSELKYGVTKETHIMLNYSFKIELKQGRLSFGLGTGIFTTNTKWSDLVVVDPGDETYLSNNGVFVVPDFSFGTYYTTDKFFAGFSIPRLLNYQFNIERNKYSIKANPRNYNYLLNTGYTFTVSKNLKLQPSVLLDYLPGEELLYDLNAQMCLFDRVWFGASYRSTKSMVALLQVSLNKQFKIAYTFDFDFDKLGGYSNGSHEIMIRYEFRYKMDVLNPLVF